MTQITVQINWPQTFCESWHKRETENEYTGAENHDMIKCHISKFALRCARKCIVKVNLKKLFSCRNSGWPVYSVFITSAMYHKSEYKNSNEVAWFETVSLYSFFTNYQPKQLQCCDFHKLFIGTSNHNQMLHFRTLLWFIWLFIFFKQWLRLYIYYSKVGPLASFFVFHFQCFFFSNRSILTLFCFLSLSFCTFVLIWICLYVLHLYFVPKFIYTICLVQMKKVWKHSSIRCFTMCVSSNFVAITIDVDCGFCCWKTPSIVE